jgi:hypothetical protein
MKMRKYFSYIEENFLRKKILSLLSKVVSFTKVSCQNFKKKSPVFGYIIGTV